MTEISRFPTLFSLLIRSILLLGFGHHVLDICVRSDENATGGNKESTQILNWLDSVALSCQTKGLECSSARRFIQICDHEGCEDQLNLLRVNLAVLHYTDWMLVEHQGVFN